MSIYQVEIDTGAQGLVSLSAYQGKVLLIVNVASKCGLTSQYVWLEQLYQRYQALGLVILAFPCHQFGGQEPGTLEDIQAFTRSCYRVSFPIFAKIAVKGQHQAPIYRYITQSLPKSWLFPPVPWNFTKFLVNRTGQVVHRFLPITPKWYIEWWIKRNLV